MQVPGPSRRFFLFPQRKRWKDSTTARLTLDAVRTSLELINYSADICPPLKSAVGAVIGLCNLADRVAACDANAETLVWRSIAILDMIYNLIDVNKPIPSDLLQSIVHFEQLVVEIRTAMEDIMKKKRVPRVLHLRRNESQLAKFTARLDSAAEIFTIGSMTVQRMSLARIEDKVETVSTVASALEHSNVLLRDQVKFLQLAIVFLA
ncbi:hypothetical protein MVEN_01973800 [Mycena venus]|uniref:Uncharacterized protein n=1 Tax=Mycena venus TaxID=2733690 RepID=A0A8H6XE90_9AGAR|nr:hypothetical protein MVEN_01973800 [Mycena venus]